MTRSRNMWTIYYNAAKGYTESEYCPKIAKCLEALINAQLRYFIMYSRGRNQAQWDCDDYPRQYSYNFDPKLRAQRESRCAQARNMAENAENARTAFHRAQTECFKK